MKLTASLLLVAASAASVSAATDLAVWNFNNSVAGSGGAPGTFLTTGVVEYYDSATKTLNVASHGVLASNATVNFSNLSGSMGGAANNNWGSFGGSTLNAFSGDASGGSLSVIGSGQNGKYVDFKLSTAGYENVGVSFVTQRTGTGANSQVWSVSSDGINFTTAYSLSSIPTAYGVQSFGLEDSYSDLSELFLRVTFSGASSTSGNNRLDNIRIAGDLIAIPEPSTYAALFGVFVLGFSALRQRRTSVA